MGCKARYARGKRTSLLLSFHPLLRHQAFSFIAINLLAPNS